MPASIAILLTFSCILGAFFWDARRGGRSSPALWLPVIWICITGSRFPSQWLQLGNSAAKLNVADGSPLDATFFGSLIVVGFIVLVRRRAFNGPMLKDNLWILLLLFYGFVSITWSDFPFIALKRWVKALGHPMMALVILTDPDPMRSLKVVMKRAAFLLLPLSVLFVKYLPQYGRTFDHWTGEGLNIGVMLTKNDLGYVCMIFGVFFVWLFLSRMRVGDPVERRNDAIVSLGSLLVIAYLLLLSDSATSIMTLAIGSATLIGLGSKFVSRRYFGTYLIIFSAVIVSIELSFDVYEKVVGLLGRDPTLTDRAEVWVDAIALQTRPLIGMGYESFWLGSRLDWMSAKWWWQPNQAHNGYIETYLNLGYIGLFLFTLLIVSTFRKVSSQLKYESEFEFSRFRLSMLFAILAHNYTEATFKGVHLLWTMFHIVVLNVRKPESVTATDVVRKVDSSGFPRRQVAPRTLPRSQ